MTEDVTLGEWEKRPSVSGYYLFRGHRIASNNAIVTVEEMVRVEWHVVGREGGYAVTFFGRTARFRLDSFVGEWRRIKTKLQQGEKRERRTV
jgi:hypothetical protein